MKKSEFELLLDRIRRKRKGADIQIMSDRQYYRLRRWCKQHLAEIIIVAMLAMLWLAGAYLWTLAIFGLISSPVVVLWRCYQRDVECRALARQIAKGGHDKCKKRRKKGAA